GPGRGSAAGSAVAYCNGITNIDPIKYDLLFERFLNPERVSMPDIDIDFDDVGRSKVIDYVIEKYGRNQVAQIITYGSMAAKSSLRDVGRVLDVPLPEVDTIAKTFPLQLGATLKQVLAPGDIDAKLKGKMNSEDVEKAYNFRALAEGSGIHAQLIQTAVKLEGSVRNTGIHACGVIITPGDITNYVPVTVAKDSDLLVTQFDNSVAEDAGLLKMDFLGLKTLSIIKDATILAKQTQGVDIDPDLIPLEDELTYKLFQRGETVGVFQYESTGMQKYMRELIPTKFEDLIAMNALYRPGPLAYIPNFVARKNGKEAISYDLPDMEEYLSETYGITVYQEQVMLLSQKLANFSKGEADSLRKAMGKKKKSIIDKMWPTFLEGCQKNGHPEEVVKKIWTDWEAFASYAFNKSHSTCYAFIAFQTAYLKAHYPAEFMASVLTHNKSDITKVTFFLRECVRMNLVVLGPDINESFSDFSVNKKGEIRFGMSALKGVGVGPVELILEERNENGLFADVFDLVRRLNPQALNKRVTESLILGGAFDCFKEIDRSTFFSPSEKYDTFMEHVLKFGNAWQAQKAQASISLFGDSEDGMIPTPKIPQDAKQWSLIEKLTREKEVTGIYISGHPLDDYKLEVNNFTSCTIDRLEQFKGQQVKLAAIVTTAQHRISKKGTGWGLFSIQDYNETLEFPLFSEDYKKFKHLFEPGEVLFITAKYQKRYNSEEFQLKIQEVRQLDSIGKEMTESIVLKLPLEDLTEEFITNLDKLCKKSKGQHKLKMTLMDRTNQNKIKFVSQERKVKVDGDFLKELDSRGILYKVNG
ncbi:MAG: DNA polymerase-3 subunit alpha, partial [Patescibacteria group bacterium]